MDPVTTVVDGRTLRLTHLDKVLFADGTTKAELLDYYRQAAPALIPVTEHRPITLWRYVEGGLGQGFVTKAVPPGAPDWLPRVPGPDGTTTHVAVDDCATLLWIANSGGYELHVTQALPGRGPDRLVIDLDPGAPASLPECARVAVAARPLLQGAGLEPWACTSGGKGLQLYCAVPEGTDTHGLAKQLAQGLAQIDPDGVTAVMAKVQRPGKVFVDYNQNAHGRTTIAPWSLRVRYDNPTVATPVGWDEVEAGLEPPETYTPAAALARLG